MASDQMGSGKKAAVLMLQGTASDVGKSIITTALCRIFTQDGYRTAPFKSQNMALNSYVTPDGKEIGRAQGVQAEACGIMATTDMNPILIKPMRDMHSQIVVHGAPFANMSAADYRNHFLPEAKGMVMEALDRLRGQHDVVVMEGAGSPAEINLKQRDIVNMNLAGWADAPVLLISDIDRGGVFASIVGTMELLEPHERERVKGFIINKFRGDISLLQPGLDWLEERTGLPVLGVLPYVKDLRIEAEDSVVLDSLPRQFLKGKDIDIAVIRYPRISNFTDLDALAAEEDVSVRYVTELNQLGSPDIMILPGTKDTIGDLQMLKASGLDQAIRQVWSEGSCQLVGVCGGYQMLGDFLVDPDAVEHQEARVEQGLGLLPLTTTFMKEKRTVRVQGVPLQDCPIRIAAYSAPPCAADLVEEANHKPAGVSNNQDIIEDTPHTMEIDGYEIHMGITEFSASESVRALFRLLREDGTEVEEGCGTTDGRVWGTYLHGIFDNDRLRRAWLDQIREQKGLQPRMTTFSAREVKNQEFDRVAAVVREHLDMDCIYQLLQAQHGIEIETTS
ncbi:cobyric acid synthase [Paenibacillus massiliensis]|uniref:cobyric acid synthase n=1 Tax=Paenibacillus massiliensis TaxID=225917 RepID=UPI00046F79AC|nr:cobyric acid synthase [Paenibacillus massiliensis]